MFRNSAYMTIGFQTEIPDQLKWSIVNRIKSLQKADYKVDYLQVFDLEKDYLDGHFVQKITHHQEQPDHSEVTYLLWPDDKILNTKVYVLDENDRCTYMLASEY